MGIVCFSVVCLLFVWRKNSIRGFPRWEDAYLGAVHDELQERVNNGQTVCGDDAILVNGIVSLSKNGLDALPQLWGGNQPRRHWRRDDPVILTGISSSRFTYATGKCGIFYSIMSASAEQILEYRIHLFAKYIYKT